MVTLSRSSSVRDRERHDVALDLGVGLRLRRLRDLRLRPRGKMLAVGGLGVALDLAQRGMAGDRHDLMRGAVALGHDTAAALAQAVRHTTVGQSGRSHLLSEPGVEALLAERATPLVDKEGERIGRAGAGFDGGDKRRRQRYLDLYRLALAVLFLGVDQPAVSHMLGTERDAVPAAKCNTKE